MLTMLLDSKKAPLRPILVYDADCNFCRYWVRRWQKDAAETGDCIPLQDGRLSIQFPEISRKEWEKAIHLIDRTGAVYSGAEAVFRFRAMDPRHRLLLKLYCSSKIFSAFAESVYRFVSRNRSFFSWIWGTCSDSQLKQCGP